MHLKNWLIESYDTFLNGNYEKIVALELKRYRLSPQERDEAFHDILSDMWRRGTQQIDQSHPRAYIARIVHNFLMDKFRKAKRDQRDKHLPVSTRREFPDDRLKLQELYQQLWGAVEEVAGNIVKDKIRHDFIEFAKLRIQGNNSNQIRIKLGFTKGGYTTTLNKLFQEAFKTFNDKAQIVSTDFDQTTHFGQTRVA